MKVSMLKRPRKLCCPMPAASVSTSPWYQDKPKGELGTWITKKSKPFFGGNPSTKSSSFWASPSFLIVKYPAALGRQGLAPADTTIGNEMLVGGGGVCA